MVKYLDIYYGRNSNFSGSHGAEYEDGSPQGYGTMQFRRSRPTFQRCVLLPSSAPYGGGSTHL
jgi:hypothetical protein